MNRTPLAPLGTIVIIQNRPNGHASWAPHGEDGWYIGLEIEHYICHETYTPKTRAEIISDTVEFPPQKINMPKMPSIDATFHTAYDLFYALHNPAPSNPLDKLGNGHKEELRTLAEIFSKPIP